MPDLYNVCSYLDEYLETTSVKKDDSFNGLQIEGNKEVTKIALAVTAGLEAFKKVAHENANMIIVHHGLFWKGADPSLRGYMHERVKFLIDSDISLYTSHLPLDKHPVVGNNIQLLNILDGTKTKDFALYKNSFIGCIGILKTPQSLTSIEHLLTEEIGATCMSLPFGKDEIETVAICSGGGGYEQMLEAIAANVDLYLTGEQIEGYHLARDAKMNVIFAGHHASETVGVKALGPVLEKKFGVDTVFVDVPTGL